MKKHFFVIDDDEDEMYLINAAVQCINEDYQCAWAKSGEQALEQLQHVVPDIIFLDLRMAGMNGLQCLQSIRKISTLSQVPVILHASYMTDEAKWWGLELGAYDCLTKSALIDHMETLIERTTRRRNKRRQYRQRPLSC